MGTYRTGAISALKAVKEVACDRCKAIIDAEFLASLESESTEWTLRQIFGKSSQDVERLRNL